MHVQRKYCTSCSGAHFLGAAVKEVGKLAHGEAGGGALDGELRAGRVDGVGAVRHQRVSQEGTDETRGDRRAEKK